MKALVSSADISLAGLPTRDQILDHVVVSFDVFDTLVVRPFLKPADLFRLVEWELRREFSAFATGWAERRIAAERAARSRAWSIEKRPEIEFHELRTALALDFNELVARRGMEIEAALELAMCRARPGMIEYFAEIVALRRRVVLVSDTYMASSSVAQLLRNCGFEGYERLFVSSSIGQSKANGGIFAVVLRDLGVQPKQVLHIGDDVTADGRKAREAGLNSAIVPKLTETWKFEPTLPRISEADATASSDGAFWSSVAATLYVQRQVRGEGFEGTDSDSLWRRIGYFVGGPAIQGFSRFVLDTCRRRGVHDIWFMARDGLIVKQAIERLELHRGTEQLRYVHASRRCFNVAAITSMDSSALDFLCSGSTLMRPAQFLSRLGIDCNEPEVSVALARRFPGPDSLVKSDEQFNSLRALFVDLEKYLTDKFAIERKALIAYLSDLVGTSRDVAVVDVGWHGSLQRSLFALLDQHADFRGTMLGIYFGTFQHVIDETDRSKHSGYFFDRGRPAQIVSECRECIELIELLFAPPEPGVVRMVDRGGRIAPEFASAEQEGERMRIAALLHTGVFAWLDDVRQAGLHEASVPMTDFVRASFNRLLQQPTAVEARVVGGVPHSEGFMSGHYRELIPTPPSALHPFALRQQFRQAFWRQGYRRQLSKLQQISLGLALKVAGR